MWQTILATAGFLEEALPYTDAIPSAFIGWLLEFSANSVGRKIVGAEDVNMPIQVIPSEKSGKK